MADHDRSARSSHERNEVEVIDLNSRGDGINDGIQDDIKDDDIKDDDIKDDDTKDDDTKDREGDRDSDDD